jgi:spore germination protein GerM
VQVAGDLVAVDLSARFADVRGRDQLLAVAQVVYSLTERPPLRRVRLTVEGRALPVPTDSGPAESPFVVRADFLSVAPAG